MTGLINKSLILKKQMNGDESHIQCVYNLKKWE